MLRHGYAPLAKNFGTGKDRYDLIPRWSLLSVSAVIFEPPFLDHEPGVPGSRPTNSRLSPG
jgi:hypothetical protein